MEPITEDQGPQANLLEETSGKTDKHRKSVLASIRNLYLGLNGENLPKEELSRRRAFLDELTKDSDRISFIPDEEVEQAYDDYTGKICRTLGDWLLVLIMDVAPSVDSREGKRIELIMNWETATLINLVDDLQFGLC